MQVKKEYIDTDDDTSYYIKEYMEDNDLEFNEDTIELLEEKCKKCRKTLQEQTYAT